MNVILPYYILSHPKKQPPFLEIAQVVLSSRPGSHARQPGGVGAASAWESSFSVMGDGLVRRRSPDRGGEGSVWQQAETFAHHRARGSRPIALAVLANQTAPYRCKPVRCQALPGPKHSDAQIRTGFPLSCHSEPKPFTALRINSAEAKNDKCDTRNEFTHRCTKCLAPCMPKMKALLFATERGNVI
jgi:hypothetical protein